MSVWDYCTQTGSGAGPLNDSVFAGIVQDRALGKGDICCNPCDGYSAIHNRRQYYILVHYFKNPFILFHIMLFIKHNITYLPSNLCFRKSNRAFCIISVTWELSHKKIKQKITDRRKYFIPYLLPCIKNQIDDGYIDSSIIMKYFCFVTLLLGYN